MSSECTDVIKSKLPQNKRYRFVELKNSIKRKKLKKSHSLKHFVAEGVTKRICNSILKHGTIGSIPSCIGRTVNIISKKNKLKLKIFFQNKNNIC